MQFQRIALTLVGSLSASAHAEEASSLTPRIEADNSISWTARIDAATVRTIMSARVEPDRRGGLASPEINALNAWLDGRLAAVPWCANGWHYLTNPEKLPDGGIRVKGACRKSAH